jgi:hypothetical protein
MASNEKAARTRSRRSTADAQVSPATTNTQADVARPEVEPYSTTTADAVDPATGDKYQAGQPGWKGRAGFETVDAAGNTVPASTRTGSPRRCPRR